MKNNVHIHNNINNNINIIKSYHPMRNEDGRREDIEEDDTVLSGRQSSMLAA